MYNVFLMTHVLCFSLILPGVGYAAQIIVIWRYLVPALLTQTKTHTICAGYRWYLRP